MRKELFRNLKELYFKKLIENGKGLRIRSIKYNAVRDFVVSADLISENELSDLENKWDEEYQTISS